MVSLLIHNIQALRFFAALSVVLYHMRGQYEASGGTWLFNPFSYGWGAVDVFFVISGFIMWHTTTRREGLAYAGRFAYKRLVRIYSGYLPWFAAMLAIYAYFAPKVLNRYDLVKSAFLFPQAHSTNLLAVSWTLSFELLFYAGFGLLLIFPKRFTLAGLGLVAAVILLAIATRNIDNFLLSPLILEFVAGALLAAFLANSLRTYPLPGLAIALVLFTLGGILATEGDRVMRVATMGAGSVALLYAIVSLERLGWTCPKWTEHLGDASYGLYLCHIPVLTLVRWTIRDDLAFFPELGYLVILAGIIGLSVLWYHFYEAPAYNALIGRYTPRKDRIV